MTVTSPTSSTSSAYDSLTANSATGPTTAIAQQSLGQSDFLQLLATQLSAQDPMKPMDDTEFISQMANFSSLQQMQSLNQNFTSYSSSQQAANAPEYLGKLVTVTDSNTGNPVSGVPTAVNMTSAGVTLTISGQDFPISGVTSVAAAPTTSALGNVANAASTVASLLSSPASSTP